MRVVCGDGGSWFVDKIDWSVIENEYYFCIPVILQKKKKGDSGLPTIFFFFFGS